MKFNKFVLIGFSFNFIYCIPFSNEDRPWKIIYIYITVRNFEALFEIVLRKPPHKIAIYNRFIISSYTQIQSQLYIYIHRDKEKEKTIQMRLYSVRNEPKNHSNLVRVFYGCLLLKCTVRRNACYYFINSTQNDLYICHRHIDMNRIDFSVPILPNSLWFQSTFSLLLLFMWLCAYHDKKPKSTDRISECRIVYGVFFYSLVHIYKCLWKYAIVWYVLHWPRWVFVGCLFARALALFAIRFISPFYVPSTPSVQFNPKKPHG